MSRRISCPHSSVFNREGFGPHPASTPFLDACDYGGITAEFHEQKGDFMQRLYLSLDPSQASTGWAIIGVAKRIPRFVAGGFIDTKAASNPLRCIRQEVQRLLQTYPIERFVAKERMFYRNNLATLALAKVHGVIEEVLDGYDVFDIPSSTVRKIVGGHGCASKDLVASGVRRLLGLPRTFVFDRWDISDAASVGITYLYQAGLIDIPA